MTRELKMGLAALLAVFAIAVAVLHSQEKPLQPTEVQRLKLENSALKLYRAFDAWQERLKDFRTICEEVVKENNWPAGTQCNPDSLQIMAPKVEANTGTTKSDRSLQAK